MPNRTDAHAHRSVRRRLRSSATVGRRPWQLLHGAITISLTRTLTPTPSDCQAYWAVSRQKDSMSKLEEAEVQEMNDPLDAVSQTGDTTQPRDTKQPKNAEATRPPTMGSSHFVHEI